MHNECIGKFTKANVVFGTWIYAGDYFMYQLVHKGSADLEP